MGFYICIYDSNICNVTQNKRFSLVPTQLTCAFGYFFADKSKRKMGPSLNCFLMMNVNFQLYLCCTYIFLYMRK